jgi:hypothetical protein
VGVFEKSYYFMVHSIRTVEFNNMHETAFFLGKWSFESYFTLHLSTHRPDNLAVCVKCHISHVQTVDQLVHVLNVVTCSVFMQTFLYVRM